MPSTERFEPQAARAMASMFDDVSGRYDLLNRVMTLGQDGSWREAMWREVPEDARVVLDLCTGSGVSLPGLRRPGRTVIGVDVSVVMLEVAQSRHGGPGWSPRLACADAFRLPLREASIDAATVAFGMRNLRPRATALAEIARVLRPGGTLAVLEASAPGPGPVRPMHAFWVRTMIPLCGRLSPDPSAYRYLSESIFEFGAGPEFEQDLRASGFTIASRRSFLLGATRLWVARRTGAVGQNRARSATSLRNASEPRAYEPAPASAAAPGEREARTWKAVQLVTSGLLTAGLTWAMVQWINLNQDLPLNPAQRAMGWGLVVAGWIVFGARTAWLALRMSSGSPGR